MEGYLAEIRGFGGNFAPRNWAYCQGQLMAINTNQALFSLIGCSYGGDCRTTFALPDLRGRVPVSSGQGPGLTDRVLAQSGGTQTNTLTTNQLAPHSHAVVSGGAMSVLGTATAVMHANNTSGGTSTPSNSFLGVEGGSIGLYETTSDGTTLNAGAITVDTSGLSINASSVQVGNTGANIAVNNLQPYLVINWIICTAGLFPSRN